MFDDKYVEFEEAINQCEDLGARYLRYIFKLLSLKAKRTFIEIFNHNIHGMNCCFILVFVQKVVGGVH